MRISNYNASLVQDTGVNTKAMQSEAFFSQIAFKPTGEWKEEIVLFDLEQAATEAAAKTLRKAAFPDGTPAELSPGCYVKLTVQDVFDCIVVMTTGLTNVVASN